MPDEGKSHDDVEKFLSDQKAFEDRKQALINDLLKQRAAAMKSFDEKLAQLGYHENSAKPRKSHHKPAASAEPKGKAKA